MRSMGGAAFSSLHLRYCHSSLAKEIKFKDGRSDGSQLLQCQHGTPITAAGSCCSCAYHGSSHKCGLYRAV